VLGTLHRRLRATPSATAAGLTPSKTSVLFSVNRLGPIGLSALASSEALNPTMLSRVIGDLVEFGLLERTPDPHDRRAALVDMTAAGRKLIERIRKERTAALNEALEPMSEADTAALEHALPALEALAEQLSRVKQP
jgi:DNA-binding MarR family transcriptional regulator